MRAAEPLDAVDPDRRRCLTQAAAAALLGLSLHAFIDGAVLVDSHEGHGHDEHAAGDECDRSGVGERADDEADPVRGRLPGLAARGAAVLERFCAALEAEGVRMGPVGRRVRAVTHLDVSAEGIETAIDVVTAVVAAGPPGADPRGAQVPR